MSEVLNINDRSELQDLIDTEETVVVKFWAQWCGPCKLFAPVFDDAAEKSDATFVAVDIDKADWAMVDFGVRGIPAVRMIRGGSVTDVKSRRLVPLLNDIK